jgi:hypothetical protein
MMWSGSALGTAEWPVGDCEERVLSFREKEMMLFDRIEFPSKDGGQAIQWSSRAAPGDASKAVSVLG